MQHALPSSTGQSFGREVMTLFRQEAGITDAGTANYPFTPSWFVTHELNKVTKQPDEAALCQQAERLWPYVDWMKEDAVDANRARWYKAVARQRKTFAGWVLDKGSKAPDWGQPSPRSYGQRAH